jgi:phenylacetate-CoA ligase
LRSVLGKVYDCYGLAERVMYSGECPTGEGHHLYMEYGITEVVDNENNIVEDGTYGRLIATSLHNYGMPLIRYEVGDVTAYKKNPCSCGRGLPLLEAVTTKAEDIVITSDGRFISSSVLTHPFKPMCNIEKSQIIQESPDEMVIKIVQRENYRELRRFYRRDAQWGRPCHEDHS